MNRKWVTLFLVGLLVCFPLYQLIISLVGMNRTIIIAGGPDGGLYHPIALSLKGALDRSGRKVEVIATDGTIENLKLIAKGEVDFAFVQPGAYQGLMRYEPSLLKESSKKIDVKLLDRVSFVVNLYSQPLHIAVREGSGIRSLKDLKGKRINLGVKLSGDYPMSRLLLESLEIEKGKLHTHFSYPEMTMAFKDDQLDAAFITVGMHASVFQNLAKSGKIYFLSIPNNEALAAMQLQLTPFQVPRGIYQFEGSPVPSSDISTVATGAHLIARKDMNSSIVERVAEELLNTAFLKENKLQELFNNGKEFAKSKPFFPIHEGARMVYEPETRSFFRPEIVEMWENLRSFIVSVCVALFFGYKWFRKRKDRLKDNKIDDYVRRVLEIERQQMHFDIGGSIDDLPKLQDLENRLTKLREECFSDFSGYDLQDEPGTDCFLELCASLSEKINAKMSRFKLGGEIQRLVKVIESEKKSDSA